MYIHKLKYFIANKKKPQPSPEPSGNCSSNIKDHKLQQRKSWHLQTYTIQDCHKPSICIKNKEQL